MRASIPVFVLGALVVGACQRASGSERAPLVANLGLAAEGVYGAGRLRLVTAAESGGDLDGDGDREDLVVHVLDLELGTLLNTRVALAFDARPLPILPPPIACSDTLAVCLVSERRSGRDLDGDGQESEAMTAVYDRRTGALAFLPFAHRSLELAGDLVAFVVEEGELAALQVFDARDGSLTAPTHELARLIEVRDGLVAYSLAELGALDLNQDGDVTDASVLHVYDADARRVVNTGWNAKDGWAQLAGGFAGFDVSEAEQGGRDLDGDGEANDTLFVAVDPRSGLTRLPGFPDARFLSEGGGVFLLAVSEADGDRNGDGDVLDWIAVLYDARADERLGPDVASASRPFQSGPWIGLTVSEYGEGLDLDGDGELFSTVPHVFDARSGTLSSLGFRGVWLAGLDGHLLGLRVVGGSDFVESEELFSWSAATGAVRLMGLDPLPPSGVAGDSALFQRLEDADSGDLNHDRDVADLVLVSYDGRLDAMRNLGLVVSGDVRLEAGGRAAALVFEAAQGRDLDGDGQLLSHVLHTLDLRL